MGLKSFLSRFGKRQSVASDRIEPEPRPALASLDISDPLAYIAARSLFPLAFSVGAVPIRARAVRLAVGADAFDDDDSGPWFVWKADTPEGKLVGYWHLPGPGDDAATLAAWAKAASSIASAAASGHKAALASLFGTPLASFAAGPCAAPPLRGKPVFRLDFDYAARGVFRSGRAYASAGYPRLIAAKAGCPADGLDGYPIEALAAASEAMTRESLAGVWPERAFPFASASGPRTYLPVYELFNLLSDDDLRLVIQNNLALRARGAELGSLFMYRGSREAENGAQARVATPHSFDHARVDALFPIDPSIGGVSRGD